MDTPPKYEYRPPEYTYGEGVDISEAPYAKREYKSRVEAGTVFFRSREVGTSANTISVECERMSGISYDLTVRKGDITEVFTFSQADPIAADSNTEETWPVNAVEALRVDVNLNSSLIDMPERKYDVVDNNGTDSRTGRTINRGTFASVYPLDETHIDEFAETFLYGGEGTPDRPSDITPYPRTGPHRTCMHINWSERNTDDGTMQEINKIVEWDGDSWEYLDIP